MAQYSNAAFGSHKMIVEKYYAKTKFNSPNVANCFATFSCILLFTKKHINFNKAQVMTRSHLIIYLYRDIFCFSCCIMLQFCECFRMFMKTKQVDSMLRWNLTLMGREKKNILIEMNRKFAEKNVWIKLCGCVMVLIFETNTKRREKKQPTNVSIDLSFRWFHLLLSE